MNHTEEFLSSFSPLPENLALPQRVSAVYEPVSDLAGREGRPVLLLRRRQDGALFVLKQGPMEDMEAEREVLARLAPALPGAVPEPGECFCEDGDGYFLRSYLPGETLAQYRERMGGCSPKKCGEIGRELCGLLEVLHSQTPPVIHRDIKPENVILLPGGGVGLIDFGIARQYTPGQDTDTRHLGTRATAAPEQYGYAQTDPRTDLYAAGATLLWLAAGSYDRAGLSSLPRWLGRTLGKAMDFDPADRWPSAAAMGDALARKLPWKKILPGALAAAAALAVFWWALPGRGPGASDVVDFPSEVLEAAVREELAKPEGPVTYGDLERVERLAALGSTTFTREEVFDCRVEPYLDEVWMGDVPRGDVSDLSLLAYMPNLREVYLCKQEISDVAVLRDLPLTTLALYDNEIEDVSPVGEIASLERLYLGANPARDYSALSGLRRLRLLNLDSLDGPDGAFVDSFAFLEGMDLDDLSLCLLRPADRDWSPLSTLVYLHVLHLWHAPEEAAAAARSLPNLTHLTAGDWNGGDLSSLAGMTGLEYLAIYGKLESFAGAETLTGLKEIFVTDSAAAELTPLSDLPELERIELHRMPIEDFSPLSTLGNLKELGVDPEMQDAARAALPEGAELMIS